jgi:hypothetical protein
MVLRRPLTPWLAARRARGEAILREAETLHLSHGARAYWEARTRARACRVKGDRVGARYWSKVAAAIAANPSANPG